MKPIIAAFLVSFFFQAQAQNNDDGNGQFEKLDVGITYEQYVKALANIKLPGFSVSMNDKSDETFISMFMVNTFTGMVTVMNESAFQIIPSKSDEFVVQKRYEISNRQAVLGKNKNVAEDGVELNILLIKFPEKKFVLMFSADAAIPVSTLEDIAKQFKP